MRNSIEPLEADKEYGNSMDVKRTAFYGQFDSERMTCDGICRLIFAQPNSHVYEGQIKNERRNGFGR